MPHGGQSLQQSTWLNILIIYESAVTPPIANRSFLCKADDMLITGCQQVLKDKFVVSILQNNSRASPVGPMMSQPQTFDQVYSTRCGVDLKSNQRVFSLPYNNHGTVV